MSEVLKKNKLKYYRIWRCFTQVRMAKELHIAITTYRRYEKNETYVSTHILKKACKLFGINFCQIWSDEDNE